MHPLLARQLRRITGGSAPDASVLSDWWPEFLTAVNEAYEAATVDRELIDRSMEIASEELMERNQQLLKKNRELENIERDLRRSNDELERRAAEREHAEELLRTSEENYRTLVQNVNLGVYRNTGGPRGRLLQANPATARMFGYESVDELMKIEIADLYPDPKDRQRFIDDISKTGSVKGRVVRHRKKDGTLFWCSVSAQAHFKADGSVNWTDGIIEDITERKQMEESLKQSEQRFRTIADALPQMIWTAEPDGSADYCNAGWCSYTGLNLEQTRGWGWGLVVHSDDAGKFAASWADCIQQGADFTGECRIKQASNGAYRWFLVRGVAIRDSSGAITQWVGSCTDIDDHKRTLQIEAAKIKAESANRAKSEFLSRMSHEIRTPLNGVVGMIDVLLATELSDVQKRYLQLCREASDVLLSVISDILDYSKIEAGKLEIKAMEFDLRKLVEDLVELLSPLAVRKKVILSCDTGADVPHCLIGDANCIRQVLTNLANNALKFTPRGSIVIRVSVDRATADGTMVRVEVADTGIGIAADRIDRLFKSFSQIDSSTTPQSGGTGLGLAISKRLVEMMGGEIGVQSQEGKGTTFWFTLKLGVAAGLAQAAVPGPANRTTLQSPESSKPLHLLVAEDNEMNQFVTQQILQLAGWTCEIVADGLAAVEAVRRKRYDAVLMDRQMPGIDGLEATRLIRQWEHIVGSPRPVPIIALTADAMQGDREKCLTAGMDGYVSKPINAPELFAAIKSLTESHADEGSMIGVPA